MGEVYLAEDTKLHRNVALKILPENVATNHDPMRRFEQEATAAAGIVRLIAQRGNQPVVRAYCTYAHRLSLSSSSLSR